MSFIHSVRTDVPNYALSQLEFYEAVAPHTDERFHKIFKRILDATQIKKRHFSMSVEEMIDMTKKKRVADKFALWKDLMTEHFTNQCSKLIYENGLVPTDIDLICTSTSSGFITPDIGMIVRETLGLRSNIRRMPLFGFGCSGGMAAINRVAEYLQHHTTSAALVCVGETLSTQYETAESVSVLVSNSIFGDGYATMLMVGKDHPLASESQIELLNSESLIFPNCNFAVGQWMTDEGIHSHVDAKLPGIIREGVAEPLNKMFSKEGYEVSDVDYWICHAGGPKVMEAFQEEMNLREGSLNETLNTYSNHGNQSAVSVITALESTLQKNKKPGLGYMMALGPGVHMEYGLCKVTPRVTKSNTTSLKGEDALSEQKINSLIEV